MKSLVFFSLLWCTLTSVAQNFEVTGYVTDQQNKPIESATVYVESVQDSTMIAYTISDEKGFFELSGRTKEAKLSLFVSYTGMAVYKKELSTSANKIHLEQIVLKENSELLNEVVVVAERAPIVIKKDTLQFNAASFKTGADANVETLLKKLPGVIVDSDGNITVNGKKVNKILVNGKEFFGSDLTIATKKLPKEIIDKIQAVDTKTKDQAFTGEEGDKENKTINITIKEDKNKGFFGRITTGYGTDERYSVSGILNYFNEEERLSVLSGSNNINTSGFNNDEVKDIGGGSNNWRKINGVWQQTNPLFSNSSNGITQATTAGVHYANEWNKKTDLGTDYLFDQNDSETKALSRIETFLPNNSSYITTSTSSSDRKASGHNFNLEFETKPDTLTRISVAPSFSKSNGDMLSTNTQRRSNSTEGVINNSFTSTLSTFDSYSANFDGNISRKFKVAGESLGLWLNSGYSNNDSEDIFKSTVDYTDTSIADENENQLKVNRQTSDFLNAYLRYTRVLKGNWFYELGMRSDLNSSFINRETFDYNLTNEQYDVVNIELTNRVKTKTTLLAPSAGIKYKKDKLNIRFNVGYNFTELENKNVLNNTAITNTFTSMNFMINLWKRIGQGKSIWARIANSANVPQISQIQPVVDNTNPLNTIVGNPNLKASNVTRISFSYRNFNMKKKSGYNLYASTSLTDNAAISKTITDPITYKRITTYENVNGSYWAYLSGGYNKKHSLGKHNFSYNFNLNTNLSRNKGFSNGEELTTKNISVNPIISFTYNYNDLIELSPRFEYDFNALDYSIDLGQENKYTSSSLGINLETYWPKKVELANDFAMNYNPNVAEGFTKSTYMWNASLGVKMLKDKGIVKIKVYDLLNQNTSVRRYSNQDYISDTENLVLKQYFMLSFTYKVNKIGGKKS